MKSLDILLALSNVEQAILHACLADGPLTPRDLERRNMGAEEIQQALDNLVEQKLLVEVQMPYKQPLYHLTENGVFLLYDASEMADEA